MAHPDVSCDEILQAVRQFNPSKAREPDGMHAIVYQGVGTSLVRTFVLWLRVS